MESHEVTYEYDVCACLSAMCLCVCSYLKDYSDSDKWRKHAEPENTCQQQKENIKLSKSHIRPISTYETADDGLDAGIYLFKQVFDFR